jgi:aspartyl-tRNA(Asn)/glutamyl-tRNA(Gln) amidotransferase subunit B
VLVAEAERADFFEAVAKGRDARRAANWVLREVVGALNKAGGELADFPISPERLGQLIDLEEDGTVSGSMAKKVFDEMLVSNDAPIVIVDEKGLRQVSDAAAIEAEIEAVLAANPDQVAAYKGGKDKLLGFFVGRVMRATQGKANPQTVNEILRKKLAE